MCNTISYSFISTGETLIYQQADVTVSNGYVRCWDIFCNSMCGFCVLCIYLENVLWIHASYKKNKQINSDSVIAGVFSSSVCYATITAASFMQKYTEAANPSEKPI